MFHGLCRHPLHRLGDLLRLLRMTARNRTFIGEPIERGQVALRGSAAAESWTDLWVLAERPSLTWAQIIMGSLVPRLSSLSSPASAWEAYVARYRAHTRYRWRQPIPSETPLPTSLSLPPSLPPSLPETPSLPISLAPSPLSYRICWLMFFWLRILQTC